MSRTATSKKVMQVRPDAKGRIALGKLAEGISSFVISKQASGNVLLEPMVEIPAREQWLFKNSAALKSVETGIAQSKAGKVRSRGSFAKFVDEKDE